MIFDRELWLYIIYLLTGAGIVWGLIDTRRVIQAPFLYAVGMLLILCPQLYIAANRNLPDEAFWVFSLMVVLCSIALYWGYSSGTKTRNNNKYRWVINDDRAFQLGLFAASIGTIGTVQIITMGEIKDWRGWPVYWITLAKFIVPGISLILISFIQSKKPTRLIYAIFFSLSPLSSIFLAGRRSATLTLPLVYLLPWLIYNPKIRISRLAILGFIFFAFVVAYAFPYWRSQFKYGNYWEIIQNYPLAQIIEEMFSSDSEKVLEIVDGIVTAGAHYQLSNYGLGWTKIYNGLVQNYVPGGLIGQDIKDALRFGDGIDLDWISQAYGIPVASYTAKSAYTELFGEFSFFGCAVLFYVGKWFRQLYDATIYQFDGRAIIFMCFFIALPTSIAYGALIDGLITQIPQISVMLLAFKWCLIKLPNDKPILELQV
jgi:hypothetical protein